MTTEHRSAASTSSAAFIDALLSLDPSAAAPAVPAATTRLALTVKLFVLRAVLEKAAAVVPQRDVMPVLKCVQLHADDDGLRVVATDTELSVRAATQMVSVTAPGVAVFPARRLLDIVREADEGTVSIDVDGEVAVVTVGRTTWRLRLPTGADYPRVLADDPGELVSHSIDRAGFTAALQRVRYAAMRDANRINLKMIDIRGGRVTACDGARFQQAALADFPLSVRIPIDAVDDLLVLLKAAQVDTITVAESATDLIFTIGPDTFAAKKLDAQFPDMEAQLLRPALGNTIPLHLDRAGALAAIKRVRINADTNTSAIALHLQPGRLTIAAHDVHNQASETLDVGYDGPPRTLVVNHGYFADLLRTATADTLTLLLGEDLKSRKAPVMLREDDTGAIGVVQQMHIDWTVPA